MKKFLVLLLAAVMVFTCTIALADYPEKAIEIIIPANPGGDTDTTVRAIAQSLTEILGQPVVVTNMSGGAGSVAMNELTNRDADGYTVFYHHVDTLLLELLGRMDEGWKWEDALDISAVTGGGNTYCLFVRKDNDKGIVNFCLNYGSHAELTDAMRAIAGEVKAGTLQPEDINEKTIESHLYRDLPPVDLMIRTSGEERLSNFLLWQCAYSEFYFTPVLFPDFTKECFDKALEEYARRDRRMGGNTKK